MSSLSSRCGGRRKERLSRGLAAAYLTWPSSTTRTSPRSPMKRQSKRFEFGSVTPICLFRSLIGLCRQLVLAQRGLTRTHYSSAQWPFGSIFMDPRRRKVRGCSRPKRYPNLCVMRMRQSLTISKTNSCHGRF